MYVRWNVAVVAVALTMYLAGCAEATKSGTKAADAAKEGAGKVADAAKQGAGKAAEAVKEGATKAGDAAAATAEAAKKAFNEQKEKFTASMQKDLSDIDKKIDGLKTKAKDATGDAKTRIEAQLKVAEEKKKVVMDHLAKLRDAAQDGWEKTEKAITGALGDLKKAVE